MQPEQEQQIREGELIETSANEIDTKSSFYEGIEDVEVFMEIVFITILAIALIIIFYLYQKGRAGRKGQIR